MSRGKQPVITELNERSREVFRRIVESYVETGEPIGSRTLSRLPTLPLSAATIRNVMADLEECGLLYAPHTSAGRLPTQAGMRLFVNGLLEVGRIPEEDRTHIDLQCRASGRSVEQILSEALSTLSGLSRCAGMVVAPRIDRTLKQIEFVWLGPRRALVVLVTEDGMVENRILDLPDGVDRSTLVAAGNYLSARLAGCSLDAMRDEIIAELDQQRSDLDALTTRVIEAGLATWAGGGREAALIVRGQSHLLEDVTAVEDLERIRTLFEALETSEQFLRLVDLTRDADGVQIFIGAESDLFGVTGCSMIVAPYRDARERIVGAIGVIGPQRINYARIIPMVDYTAKVIGRLIGQP